MRAVCSRACMGADGGRGEGGGDLIIPSAPKGIPLSTTLTDLPPQWHIRARTHAHRTANQLTAFSAHSR